MSECVSHDLREHRVSDGANAHVVDQTKINPLYLNLSHCAVTAVWSDARMELLQGHTASKQRLPLSNLKQSKKWLCLGNVNPWALQCVGEPSEGLCRLARKRVFVTHE